MELTVSDSFGKDSILLRNRLRWTPGNSPDTLSVPQSSADIRLTSKTSQHTRFREPSSHGGQVTRYSRQRVLSVRILLMRERRRGEGL